METLVWSIYLGDPSLETLTLEFQLRQSGLEAKACELWLVTLVWQLWLEKPWLGNFSVGTLAWSLAWELQHGVLTWKIWLGTFGL